MKRSEEPKTAMLRELREEIGLTSHRRFVALSSDIEDISGRCVRMHVFLIEGAAYRFRQSLEIAEAIAVRWDQMPQDAAVARRSLKRPASGLDARNRLKCVPSVTRPIRSSGSKTSKYKPTVNLL